MLKTGFIGQRNVFDILICDWLAEHTDLGLIIWTDGLSWCRGEGWERTRNVLSRFARRLRKKGVLRTSNEFVYYLFYRQLLLAQEERNVNQALASLSVHPRIPLDQVHQIHPDDIGSTALQDQIRHASLDALFAMCIDVYIPPTVLSIPRYGIFLWHEGITPEYRGVQFSILGIVEAGLRELAIRC